VASRAKPGSTSPHKNRRESGHFLLILIAKCGHRNSVSSACMHCTNYTGLQSQPMSHITTAQASCRMHAQAICMLVHLVVLQPPHSPAKNVTCTSEHWPSSRMARQYNRGTATHASTQAFSPLVRNRHITCTCHICQADHVHKSHHVLCVRKMLNHQLMQAQAVLQWLRW